MRKRRLSKAKSLARVRILRVWALIMHCMIPKLLPLELVPTLNTNMNWMLSQHHTKASRWAQGPKRGSNDSSVWWEHDRWINKNGVSVFYTVHSQSMTAGMSHSKCGNSGNADVLKETSLTHAALWPLAALESKPCATRMWNQMPDFCIIPQG